MTTSGTPSRDISTAWAWQLMGREPSPDTGTRSGVAQLDPDSRRHARPTARGAAQHAEQRPHGQRPSQRQPRVELLPGPAVHPDLAALAALALAHQDRAALQVKIALSLSASASLTRNPARPSTTISARSRTPSALSPAVLITATISSTVGGSGG